MIQEFPLNRNSIKIWRQTAETLDWCFPDCFLTQKFTSNFRNTIIVKYLLQLIFFPTSCTDVRITSTRRIRDSAFQGSRTPGQAHAPYSRHAANGVRLELGDWARREGLVGFRVSPREAWLELTRDIVQLFLSVNLFVGEVVSDLGDLKRKRTISRTTNRLELTYSQDRRDRQAISWRTKWTPTACNF